MKKLSRILILIVVTCLLFTFVGCKKNVTLTKVNYTATIVEGDNLNLAQGELEYAQGKKSLKVALNDKDVSVTGYDKTKIGEQTLTVTYKKKSISFKVNVLSKIALEGITTTYEKGAEFDKTVGSVKVRKSDGTFDTVALTDSKVSITGFDSSVGGSCVITVSYTDGGNTYKTTANITINETKITFKKPTRTTYKNYDTELDLSGGYFLITVNGKKSYVQLSSEEVSISGYNPSAVNEDNPQEDQTISVEYNGQTYEFEVEVKYSFVSWIKDFSASMKDLDWTKDTAPTLTDEQKADAMKAQEIYAGLETLEKNEIDSEEYLYIMKAAVLATYDMWLTEAKSFEQTFTVGDGSISLGCKDYLKTKEDYQKISNPDADIHKYSAILIDIADIYASEILYGDVTVESYIKVLRTQEDGNVYSVLKPVLEFMISIHETINVPTNWTKDSLYEEATAKSIEDTVDLILGSVYKGVNYAFLFDFVSAWREKDDLAEVIYSYYYYGGDELKEKIVNSIYGKIPLPGVLQDLYVNIVNGNSYVVEYSNKPEKYGWFETVNIYYFYFEALNCMEEIEKSENELYQGLYDYIDFGYELRKYLTFNGTAGIEQLSKELFADDVFEEAWKKLGDLYEIYAENIEGINFETKATEIEEMFKYFVDMSPSWQYSFIASMLYGYRGLQVYDPYGNYALDTEMNWTFFTNLMGRYFEFKLSKDNGQDKERTDYENAQSVAKRVLFATELYATRYKYEVAYDDFKEVMAKLIEDYNSLEGAEKVAFDGCGIKYAYDRCVEVYNKTMSTATVDFGDLESVREELETVLKDFFALDAKLDDTTIQEEEKKVFRPVFLATYEYINTLASKITASNNRAIILSYYNDMYEFSQDLNCSLEHAVWSARSSFMYEMVNVLSFKITKNEKEYVYPAWEIYNGTKADKLFATAYYVLNTQYNGGTFDEEKVLAVMTAYRESSMIARDRFTAFECDNLYYEGLEKFFSGYSADVKALATELIAVEKAYLGYEGNEEKTTAKEAFITAMDKAIAKCSEVTNTTDYERVLKAMYEFYKAKYDEVKA